MRKAAIGAGSGLLVVVLAAGLLWAGRRAADVDGIREAVFRSQVAYWLDDNTRASHVVVCLATEQGGRRRSVSEDYLSRFRGETSVRRLDDCEERASGAVERRTGQPAVVVTVGDVTWPSESEALVTTRHYRSATVSGTRTQRVVREAARWTCLGPVLNDGPF
jgi:hypothetical protein